MVPTSGDQVPESPDEGMAAFRAGLKKLTPAVIPLFEEILLVALSDTLTKDEFVDLAASDRPRAIFGTFVAVVDSMRDNHTFIPDPFQTDEKRKPYNDLIAKGARALPRNDSRAGELIGRVSGAAQGELEKHPDSVDAARRGLWTWFLYAIASGPGSDTEAPPWLFDYLNHRLDTWTELIPSESDAAAEGAAITDEPEEDVGPALLQHLFGAMAIDNEWSVREPRSFTWWGHRLAQRVIAHNPFQDGGYNVVRLDSDCALTTEVSDLPAALSAVNALNAGAGLDALVVDASTGAIRSRLSCLAHAENASWLGNVLTMAIATQINLAEQRADALAAELGLTVAASSHPTNGPRNVPDDMLNLLSSPAATQPEVPLTADDYEWITNVKANWLLATASENGFTAEFPYERDAAPLGHGTSLLTVSTTPVLPVLRDSPLNVMGSHLTFRLGLPAEFPSSSGAELANRLNQLEADGVLNAHLLGAWAAEGDTLWFTSTVPAAPLAGFGESARVVVLNLAAAMGVRAWWAAATLPQLIGSL